jgi:hypothetical protein
MSGMDAAWAVYDGRTGTVESVYLDKEEAIGRSQYLTRMMAGLHGVYPVAYEPDNDVHRHYRISERDPQRMVSNLCYDPMCSRKPQYWNSGEFKYWSVESCDGALTRKMADRLQQSPDPHNC